MGEEEKEIPAISEQSGLKVYPNPTNGSFILEILNQDTDNQYTGQITDIRGKKVQDIHFNGQNKQVISLESQPKGMYFIRVMQDQNSASGKIIKQ